MSSSRYPYIDIVFVPYKNFGLGILPPGSPFPMSPGTQFGITEIPPISARAFKARFSLEDFDLRAPSLEFLDPWTNDPLPFQFLTVAQEYETVRGTHQVLLPDHPLTHKPFLCLRGIREYHEHPQHSGDDWLLYRNEMGLFAIILSVWRSAIDLVRPVMFMTSVGATIHWHGEQKA